MNASEQAALVGRHVLVREPDGLEVMARVMDVKQAYGRVRVEVEDAQGNTATVELDGVRVRLDEKGEGQ